MSISVCLSVSCALCLVRSFFSSFWLVELLASDSGSGTPLIHLGVVRLARASALQTNNGRRHLMEDNLSWKMTYDVRRLMMEEDL